MVKLTFIFLRVFFRGSPGAFRSSHVLTKDGDLEDSARPLHHSKSDSRLTRAPVLSPYYSFTHPHRSIGYHHHNPQPLTDSTVRLMYLRVYDNRDRSRQSVPSPSLSFSIRHAHRSISISSHRHSYTSYLYLSLY